MNIIKAIFMYAFRLLDLRIKIPINFNNTEFIDFPLYMPFLIGGIIDILLVLWHAVVVNRNNVE